ncbi:hypothetical protein FE391_12775 [Nonomuraea sp. KC401]|uniref:CysS/YqeB C-terminal domain-containing protein n=1 Tax=unclassified Nonomuraea TaxID=2593643 RepID=UPI0010FECEF5|nr:MULTISPECIES: hypothetical protein [unclassified Nonomuraea]NBE94713.1 hypothetical protein [Nonomuraea sp. K271]TLF75647.1 hypothetical protein FE391_12775 [Nonomuraea sp. KC401]
MPGSLVLMGSGETSPTMVEVHRAAARRLPAGARAVLLDTPYAFQENRADISARACRYFARSVGLDVEVAAGVTGADWVFSGPGSPTYALDRWAASGVAGDLRARLRARRGVTVLASAAACTAGLATVPVYEIYKAGADPHWRAGLDLLEPLGLRAVVIPHFDNAEGGTHDTRYCYLGERRLSRMERELPSGTAVLGLDEHTALVIDLANESAHVAGRGGLTVRRPGSSITLPAGTRTDLGELRRLVEGGAGVTVPTPPGPGPAAVPAGATLEETAHACEQRFNAAVAGPDMVAAAQAVLDLEAEIVKWAADTEEDSGGVEQARELMRLLIARLGEPASTARLRALGLNALVEPLLALRARLRDEGRYELADTLRTALLEGGVVVEDTPDGPRWTPAS